MGSSGVRWRSGFVSYGFEKPLCLCFGVEGFFASGTVGGGMLVEVQMNRMGAVTLTPVSKKVRRQMRAHNQEWLGHPDEDVYLQGDRGYEFLDMLSPAQRRDVEEGWGATVRMDPWIFGHYVGYDFHEVIKP